MKLTTETVYFDLATRPVVAGRCKPFALRPAAKYLAVVDAGGDVWVKAAGTSEEFDNCHSLSIAAQDSIRRAVGYGR